MTGLRPRRVLRVSVLREHAVLHVISGIALPPTVLVLAWLSARP